MKLSLLAAVLQLMQLQPGQVTALTTLSYDLTNVTLESLVFNDQGRYNGNRSNRNDDDDDDDDDDDRNRRNNNSVNGLGEIPRFRQGFRLEVGTPPQTVWLTPSLVLGDIIIRNASSCLEDDDDDDNDFNYQRSVQCEWVSQGLFRSQLSSSFERLNERIEVPPTPFNNRRDDDDDGDIVDGRMIRDNIRFPNASAQLTGEGFRMGLHLDETDDDDFNADFPGFLGLNRDSTFLEAFFPNNKVFGVSYPEANENNWSIEIDFDGADVSKSTGEIYSTAFPQDQSRYPLRVTVDSMSINGQELLNGPFDASVDISNIPGTKLPQDVFRRFVTVTGGAVTDDDDEDDDWLLRDAAYAIYNTTVPTSFSDQWNLTVRFSNGYETQIPQQYLLQNVNYPNQTSPSGRRLPRSISRITNVDRTDDDALGQLLPGATLGSEILLFSYLVVDYERNQWSIARSVGANQVIPKDSNDMEEPNRGEVPAAGDSSGPDTPNGSGHVAVEMWAVLCMGGLMSLVGVLGLV